MYNRKGRYHLLGWIFFSSIMAWSGLTLAGSQVGDISPKFNLTTLSGETYSSEKLKGNKAVYLKFWATWCSYCQEEMPHAQHTFEQSGDNLQVISINVGFNDSIKRIKRYFSKENYNLPVVFDEKGELFRKFELYGTPEHILINKEGEIIHRSALLNDKLIELLAAYNSKEIIK